MTTQRSKGFTLIEMLLVVAIIAIIISMSLVMMRKQAQDARVNKASLEMQNVLQAAITYINTSGRWPQNYACNSASSPAPSFVSYLPNNDYQSNFGSNFCWATDSQSVVRFWVALPLPGSSYQIAQQIAAQLPNAYAVTDPNTTTPRNNLCTGAEPTCYVRAEVSQTAASANGGIVAAGYCVPGSVGRKVSGSGATVSCAYQSADNLKTTYTIQFPCTAGRGNVVLTPNFLNMGWPADPPGGGPSFSNNLYEYRPDVAPNCATTNGLTTCTVSIVVNMAIQDAVTYEVKSITSPPGGTGMVGYVGASYIGYCYI